MVGISERKVLIGENYENFWREIRKYVEDNRKVVSKTVEEKTEENCKK